MPENISLKAAFLKISASIILLGCILFFPGGTFAWPQAWVYLFFYAAWALGTAPWLKKHNPELLRKRLLSPFVPVALWERIFMEAGLFLYILMMLMISVDAAGSGRPAAPVYLSIAAFVCLLAGYTLIFYAFKANKYAIKTAEAQPGQQVVGSGPYAVVRHPMYTAVCLICVATPPALGSYWGLIPAALMVFLVSVRALLEEKILMRGLHGYAEYAEKVKYRFIPGVW